MRSRATFGPAPRLAVIAATIALGCAPASRSRPPAANARVVSVRVAPTRESCESNAAFVFVAAGAFIAGSDARERDDAYRLSAEARGGAPEQIAQLEQRLRAARWFERERARTSIEQPAFCIGRDLVTNEDYAAFIAATGHPPPGITESEYVSQGFLVHPYTAVRPYLWNGNAPPPGQARHPVVLVSYGDALDYARWRGARDGRDYTLPTRDEWEKASRGTDGRPFPWGDAWRSDATNGEGSGLGRTSPVGAFPASRGPTGANDMTGNVFQFTSTLATISGRRVAFLKGCGWDDLAGFCRSAYEHTRPTESRHILIGFRLAWRF